MSAHWMYGVYAGYDTRELKAGPVDTKCHRDGSQNCSLPTSCCRCRGRFQSMEHPCLCPDVRTGTTEKKLNSHYNAGALDTAGVDVGYQINDKTKATVGYYHQTGDHG